MVRSAGYSFLQVKSSHSAKCTAHVTPSTAAHSLRKGSSLSAASSPHVAIKPTAYVAAVMVCC
jgi:hypothetical protein